MDLIEYQRRAAQLAFYHDQRGTPGHRREELLMAALGLVGESNEIEDAYTERQRDLLREELGDYGWYLAEFATALGESFLGLEAALPVAHMTDDQVLHMRNLRKGSAIVAENVKKEAFHGRYRQFQLLEKLHGLYFTWRCLLVATGNDLFEVLVENIEKLETRQGKKTT